MTDNARKIVNTIVGVLHKQVAPLTIVDRYDVLDEVVSICEEMFAESKVRIAESDPRQMTLTFGPDDPGIETLDSGTAIPPLTEIPGGTTDTTLQQRRPEDEADIE